MLESLVGMALLASSWFGLHFTSETGSVQEPSPQESYSEDVDTEIAWYSDSYYEALPDDVLELDTEMLALAQTVPAAPQRFREGFTLQSEGVQWNIVDDDTSLSAAEVYQAAVPSVVYINTLVDDEFYSFGSGVVIGSNGYIVTNYHVIEDAEVVVLAFQNGDMYVADGLIASSIEQDIAILRVNADTLPAIPVDVTQDVIVGSDMYTIGHPENLIYSLSSGIVSGVRAYYNTGEGLQYQVTNPISSGSSGGPLLNNQGELVGIMMASFQYDDNLAQVQNLNFAIPLQSIRELLVQ